MIRGLDMNHLALDEEPALHLRTRGMSYIAQAMRDAHGNATRASQKHLQRSNMIKLQIQQFLSPAGVSAHCFF